MGIELSFKHNGEASGTSISAQEETQGVAHTIDAQKAQSYRNFIYNRPRR